MQTLMKSLAVVAIALSSSLAMAGDKVEVTKAPIDTVFAQGPVNPYGKFFTGANGFAQISRESVLTFCGEKKATRNSG